MFELPTIECNGAPRDLGRAQGEQWRDLVQRFVDQRFRALAAYLAERGQAERLAEFEKVGRACLEIAERFDPEGTEEHFGIAEAAGVDAVRLYAAANMTDVRDVLVLPAPADEEGCTSVLVPPEKSRDGIVIAGQTWDLNPDDLDFVVAVHRIPSSGPETWSITCAGALSLMGMNADGVAVGTTNIKTRASRPGVGYLTILHRAIRARARAEATEVVRRAPRAAAHTYWIADAVSGVELECDPDGVFERGLEQDPIVQTNHCQAFPLQQREGEAVTESSRKRLARAGAWLARGNVDFDAVRALFADRSDGVESINRYPEDAQGTTTNACLVCVPARRELFACRGPSDRGEWRRLTFSTPSRAPHG
ncbi:MAG: C45 family peptidase [Pseudomonadota bacterium]|nr:MAG: hypothetical protein DIU78_05675 [Pseudomonadota bacterium]